MKGPSGRDRVPEVLPYWKGRKTFPMLQDEEVDLAILVLTGRPRCLDCATTTTNRGAVNIRSGFGGGRLY